MASGTEAVITQMPDIGEELVPSEPLPLQSTGDSTAASSIRSQ